MQCREINNVMMKYFDGNISELELEQLLRHNQKCAACAEEFEVLKDAIYEIEMLPDLEPPVELTAKIMDAVASQKHFHVNAKQLTCWVVGFIGLVLFTYNIISYVIFPTLGVAPVISLQGAWDVVYMLVEKAKDGFVEFSLYMGKLLVVRNIIIKEYTGFVLLWLTAFAGVGLMLYKLINMKEKGIFADLKQFR